MNRMILLTLAVLCQNVWAAPFTAEHLVRLDRVGAPVLSPDGSQVVYTLRTTDMEADKGRHDLWLTRVSDGDTRRLTRHEAADTEPAWSPDGRHVYFLSTRSDSAQVWRIDMAGGDAQQVTRLPLDVGTFRLAPGGDSLVVSMRVFMDCDDLACTRARDQEKKDSKVSALVYDELFVRHWDHWLDGKRSQLFLVELDEDSRAVDEASWLTRKIDADIPSRIWGGKEEYALTPDGRSLYFTARLRNAAEAWSTNYDLYAVPLDGDGATSNLTESNPAWDTQPALSPDGTKLAYLAMARPGFEADRYRVMVRDLESGESRALAEDWDRSASSLAWSSDGKSVYVNAQDVGNKTLWRLDLAGGRPEKLVSNGTVSSFEVGDEGIVLSLIHI